MRDKIFRFTSILLLISGLLLLVIVITPIISYQLNAENKYPKLISPLAAEENKEIDANQIDYTQASNWFIGGLRSDKFILSNTNYYSISIPKLKIKNATVAIGGEDLKKSLVHYPGTALPGRNGNSVIFGHSILPIFYDPSNYLAIFSKLPDLDKGDEVVISYDGIIYKYLVETMFEVSPTDVQILEQESSSSNLSLVTCTPPGDPRKPKRLIVRAKIV